MILLEHNPLLACFGFVKSQKWLVSRKINLRKRLNLIDVGADMGRYHEKRDLRCPSTPQVRRGTDGHSLGCKQQAQHPRKQPSSRRPGSRLLTPNPYPPRLKTPEASGTCAVEVGGNDEGKALARVETCAPFHARFRATREQVIVFRTLA